MNLLYNFFVFLVASLLPVVAFFNQKIKLFVTGRKEIFSKLSLLKGEPTIWVHVASLGEFEQARPIIEKIKKKYQTHKILVTFFSPSGYQIRKNYDLADVVCYLPLDSKSNAKRFVSLVKPTLAVFVKYEFWPNLLNELKQQNITTILVAGILRKNQLFFKSYGGFMRNSLKAFHHFFVQDENSKELLNSINFKNITVAGDTRFDRVSKIITQDNTLHFIEEFKQGKYTLVAGSTWVDDEKLLVNYINNNATNKDKFIIAPHNIKREAILELQKSIVTKSVLYSDKKDKNLKEYNVFIIDTIGLLTKIYAAADVAYVGGGLKTGLHNILEPATFGIPVIIGNNYSKFKEAVDLVKIGGCVSVENQVEFNKTLINFKKDDNFRKLTGVINNRYIKDHLGATDLIMNYINEYMVSNRKP